MNAYTYTLFCGSAFLIYISIFPIFLLQYLGPASKYHSEDLKTNKQKNGRSCGKWQVSSKGNSPPAPCPCAQKQRGRHTVEIIGSFVLLPLKGWGGVGGASQRVAVSAAEHA